MKTIDYCDSIKRRHHWDSDYRLAKELHITRAAMSKYRNDKAKFSDQTCIEAAKLLDLNPAFVILDMYCQRTKCAAAAKILKATAKQIARTTASILLVVSMGYGTAGIEDAHAGEFLQGFNTVYYVKSIKATMPLFQNSKSLFIKHYSVFLDFYPLFSTLHHSKISQLLGTFHRGKA